MMVPVSKWFSREHRRIEYSTNERSHSPLAKVSYKTFLKGSKWPDAIICLRFLESLLCFAFSVEHALGKMTKGEHAQLKLKSNATTGVEKFNIAKNTPVQYDVTLVNFEKVCAQERSTFQMIRFYDGELVYVGQRNLVDERCGETRAIRSVEETCWRVVQSKKISLVSPWIMQPFLIAI